MFKIDSFPTIDTKNLKLRRMNFDDLHDIFEMRNDLRMHEFTDSKPDHAVEDTKNYIEKMNGGIDQNKWLIWAIENKEINKVIGSISIWNIKSEERSGELGYGIIPNFQRKGYMKEALLEVIKYGFEVMQLKTIEAYTEENNINSMKLLESCNFKLFRKVDEEGYFINRIFHMLIYRLDNPISE